MVKTQIIFQVIEVVLEILTVTLDVLKLWSLSEKQFHLPIFCGTDLGLIGQTGLSYRSDRSFQRQFPEDPLSELS